MFVFKYILSFLDEIILKRSGFNNFMQFCQYFISKETLNVTFTLKVLQNSC